MVSQNGSRTLLYILRNGLHFFKPLTMLWNYHLFCTLFCPWIVSKATQYNATFLLKVLKYARHYSTTLHQRVWHLTGCIPATANYKMVADLASKRRNSRKQCRSRRIASHWKLKGVLISHWVDCCYRVMKSGSQQNRCFRVLFSQVFCLITTCFSNIWTIHPVRNIPTSPTLNLISHKRVRTSSSLAQRSPISNIVCDSVWLMCVSLCI